MGLFEAASCKVLSVESPALVAEWDRRLLRWEDDVAATVERYLERQRKVVVARLTGAKTRRAVLERGRVLDVKSVVDVVRWRAELKGDLGSVFRRLFEEVGSDVMGRIGGGLKFDVGDLSTVTLIDAVVRKAVATEGFESRIVARLERERDRILRKNDLEELARRLSEEYSVGAKRFARRLASGSVIGSVNAATFEAGRQSGRVREKVWVTMLDPVVRDSHAAAHGQVRESNGLFVLGSGSLARFPNDPALPVEDWINCRCSLAFRVSEVGGDPVGRAGAVLARALGLGSG
jgi:hypothetical protein